MVAHAAQQAFTGMSNGFQGFEMQEPAGALDGMERAKDTCQRVGWRGATFQFDYIAVEAIEALAGFDQELPNDLVSHGHSSALP